MNPFSFMFYCVEVLLYVIISIFEIVYFVRYKDFEFLGSLSRTYDNKLNTAIFCF